MTKKKKAKSPILPGNLKDPTGADRLERGAMNEFARRMKRIGKAYKDILDRIPASPSVNQRYTFDLDSTQLSMLLSNASLLVDEILGADNETGSGSGLITSTRRINAARRRSSPICHSSLPCTRQDRIAYRQSS